MSALARVLAGRTAPGVYRWDSAADVDDVRHAVEHAGWRFVHLDTWQVEDKAAFLAACAEAFEFPDWFGRNLDALADSLGDVRGEGGVLVLWDGWSPIARHDRRVFDVVSDIFVGRVHFERGGRFAVLVRGPGPDDSGLAPAPGD
jgi:RNAse (barnase) inhibitor barstar